MNDKTLSPEKPAKRSRWRYVVRLIIAILVLPLLILFPAFGYSAAILNAVEDTAVTASLLGFDGSYLLAVSDADMVGTAYANGVLMQIPGERDTLSIISLPLTADAPQISEVTVSNSVTSWPQVLKTSPNGERAYIVETAAEIPDNVIAIPDIQTNPPNGRSLTVVDLQSGEKIVYDIMDYALHLDVHPEEKYVAIGSAAQDEQLAILPVNTLDDPATYQFFAIENATDDPATEITSVNWHPSGNFLAVGIDRSELRFFEVIADAEGVIELQPHGERLVLGNTITFGQFIATGDYYFTADINWSALPGRLGYIFNPPGEMIAIQFDASISADHSVASRVPVGQSPEGFAVSPDGSLVVTVDMRRTYLPDNLSFIPGTDLNSLSLLTFDHATGELNLVDQYGFKGVLPEHAMFDADGDALAVVIYNERENPMGDGYLDFWNVGYQDDTPFLERTTTRLAVTRGIHTLELVP